MKINQAIREAGGHWKFLKSEPLVKPLVLVFGGRLMLESPTLLQEVRELYPDGELVFGSTSGEILNANVYEDTVVLTAITFERSSFHIVRANAQEYSNIDEMGRAIANQFTKTGLKHLFVVSDGSLVNGSGLIEGLESFQESGVSITGGLCGDGARFERTLSAYNESPKQGEVIAIGFYGDSLEVSYANYGGWTPFGPERTITKSEDNVLYEIDGRPALDLYKAYLGEKAKELPQAALLYPLTVQQHADAERLVRTILSIDEHKKTMILAGDVPVGSKVQLMMCTVADITQGASHAAKYAMRNRKQDPQLALLVSCVGRKLVLAERTEEEIEEVVHVVGNEAIVTGFYSYGEMAPFAGKHECQLHNQTMTLTLMSE
ncbi:MAG: FIST N-terminal domain-containing protein [Bacteroidota bacterium]